MFLWRISGHKNIPEEKPRVLLMWNSNLDSFIPSPTCLVQLNVRHVQGIGWDPSLDRMPFCHRVNSHTHSNSIPWGQWRHLSQLNGTPLGCERKIRDIKLCKLHTDSGPAGSHFFPHQCYNEWHCYVRTYYRNPGSQEAPSMYIRPM